MTKFLGEVGEYEKIGKLLLAAVVAMALVALGCWLFACYTREEQRTPGEAIIAFLKKAGGVSSSCCLSHSPR